MTNLQRNAIWELLRQGLHRYAELAEQRWDDGEKFDLDPSVHVPRMLRHLVKQGNWQATHYTH